MAIFIPNDTTQKLTPLRTPQYTTSVTPEMIAGPEVRNLEALGKTAGEITDWVITDRNNKDLAIINDIENKGKEIEMRRKLAASKMMGKNALGLLAREEAFLGSNYKQPDGEPPLVEVQEYQKMYGELDDRLKTVSDNLRGRRKISHLSRIGAHEQAQSIAHTVQSANDSITLSIASSAVNHLDEEQRMLDIAMIDSQIDAIANAQGWDYAQRELKRKTAVSSIHVDVVKGYINAKDVAGAEKYFSKNKDEIVGDTSAMQQSIATRGVDIKAESIADEAQGLASQGKLEEANALIDKQDPDIQKSARAEFDASQKASEAVKTANRVEAFKTINKQVLQDKVEKFSDLDQEALNVIYELPDADKHIERIRKNFVDRDKAEGPSLDDELEGYQELNDMASGSDEEKKWFMTTDIHLIYGAQLGETNQKHFIDLQRTMKEKKTDSITGKSDHLNARVGLLGLNQPGFEIIKHKMITNKNQAVLDTEDAKGGSLP